MKLRTQILVSMLGLTILAQVVFGMLAYRQITESRGDQLTIFLQYLNREIAERITLPGNAYVTQIYLDELRYKFSTPKSILIIQKNKQILYHSGITSQDIDELNLQLTKAYNDSDKHGLIELDNEQYYWAVSPLPNDQYQLVMLEPAHNEEKEIASTLRLRLISSGSIIIWMAIWVSLVLSTKISGVLENKNDQLEHMALHDNLTGLPNRTSLHNKMEIVLSQSIKNNDSFALFLMDLDRFKEVNDTLGHQFGDELLKMVGKRLSDAIRNGDSIARLGGDEFAVLLPKTNLKGAELCAKRILNAMDALYSINDITTESKASIGVALYPEHGANSEILLQLADVAMYQAKKSQSGYAVYDPEQNTHSVRRLRLMNDLRIAIENNEIIPYFQPIVNHAEKTITGVEALARWHHNELGNISPEEFIPMVEQMGLIRQQTLQIIDQSLKNQNSWNSQGHNISININLSVFCLQDYSLPDEIMNILNTYNVKAEKVVLEITESALMLNIHRAVKILNKLKEIGFELAIDDFGTGFSSLNYLKILPVDSLKIDKCFISDMSENKTDRAVVKTIVELGHNLNCKVIAEGVEDEETLDSLMALNVDKIQGYYFSKPLPDHQFIIWMNQYKAQNNT